MLSTYEIEKTLVGLVTDLIGSKLSTTGSGTNLRPSVIREGTFSTDNTGSKNAVTPNYPYASIGLLQTKFPFKLKLSEGFDDDDIWKLRHNVDFHYGITIHGDSRSDIETIARELKLRFSMSRTKSEVTNATSTVVYNVTEPFTNKTLFSDQYKFTSSITLVLSAIEVLEDLIGSGWISQVGIDTVIHKDSEGKGGLYHAPDDLKPIPIKTGLVNGY